MDNDQDSDYELRNDTLACLKDWQRTLSFILKSFLLVYRWIPGNSRGSMGTNGQRIITYLFFKSNLSTITYVFVVFIDMMSLFYNTYITIIQHYALRTR